MKQSKKWAELTGWYEFNFFCLKVLSKVLIRFNQFELKSAWNVSKSKWVAVPAPPCVKYKKYLIKTFRPNSKFGVGLHLILVWSFNIFTLMNFLTICFKIRENSHSILSIFLRNDEFVTSLLFCRCYIYKSRHRWVLKMLFCDNDSPTFLNVCQKSKLLAVAFLFLHMEPGQHQLSDFQFVRLPIPGKIQVHLTYHVLVL